VVRMVKRQVKLGADIGGTFTDVVLEVDKKLYSTKVLTTYGAPEDAILDGIGQVCTKANVDPAEISILVHGTTLATNSLIERRGAKTALITTKGFRDVIEMRTESRFEQYDLNLNLPESLIERERRFVLDERVDAQGQILKPLNRADVEALADEISGQGFESIAVGFLHSYLNDTHEQMVREVLGDKLPDVMISLSSEVSPQMREYERFNTVAANAYVKPLMKSYLSRLSKRVVELGADCPIFLMHSGGGIISLESAAEFPVRLVESGPAGGAIFAAHVAAAHGMDKVLSFDMGGTTAKICLIKDQTPKTSRVFEVARTYRFKKGSGMPISIPVIDMVEIGAGGGSLAHVDAMQQIRVGPESAGSEPGPACYKRGGERPAVTDADLVLGRLDPDSFAGGTIPLSKDNSKSALKNVIGSKLQLDDMTAAFGVSEVVDENMANAARVHAVENGEDLSTYSMIAFGGAAPLHAGRLCEKLGIDTLLVPSGAGVGSAIGFLKAPFSFEASRSLYVRLSAFDDTIIKSLLAELTDEATAFVRSCDATAPITSDYKAFMRYVGQGWEIPIALTAVQAANPTGDMLKELFEIDYAKLFGRTVEGQDIEITSWSVNSTTPSARADKLTAVSGKSLIEQEKRAVFEPSLGKTVEASVIERSSFAPGDFATGPLIITEDETTIVTPTGFTASMASDGTIILTKGVKP
jgi:N-methylhydantoinase A